MFSCVVREKRELPTKKKKKKGEDEKLGEGFLCASKMWEIIITSGSKSSLFTQVVGEVKKLGEGFLCVSKM
jgi:hypothetical protein